MSGAGSRSPYGRLRRRRACRRARRDRRASPRADASGWPCRAPRRGRRTRCSSARRRRRWPGAARRRPLERDVADRRAGAVPSAAAASRTPRWNGAGSSVLPAPTRSTSQHARGRARSGSYDQPVAPLVVVGRRARGRRCRRCAPSSRRSRGRRASDVLATGAPVVREGERARRRAGRRASAPSSSGP